MTIIVKFTWLLFLAELLVEICGNKHPKKKPHSKTLYTWNKLVLSRNCTQSFCNTKNSMVTLNCWNEQNRTVYDTCLPLFVRFGKINSSSLWFRDKFYETNVSNIGVKGAFDYVYDFYCSFKWPHAYFHKIYDCGIPTMSFYFHALDNQAKNVAFVLPTYSRWFGQILQKWFNLSGIQVTLFQQKGDGVYTGNFPLDIGLQSRGWIIQTNHFESFEHLKQIIKNTPQNQMLSSLYGMCATCFRDITSFAYFDKIESAPSTQKCKIVIVQRTSLWQGRVIVRKNDSSRLDRSLIEYAGESEAVL